MTEEILEVRELKEQLAAVQSENVQLQADLRDALRDSDYQIAGMVRQENENLKARMSEILALEDIEYPDGDENVVSVVNDALEHLRNERDEAVKQLAAARAENEQLETAMAVVENRHLQSRRLLAAVDDALHLRSPLPPHPTVQAVAENMREFSALRARAADPGRVREQVQWFAKRMERKLQVNDHKGGWCDCKIGLLVKRINEEIDEMCNAHVRARLDQREGASDAKVSWEKVIDEAADVANFAMMVADQARSEAAADGTERSEKKESDCDGPYAAGMTVFRDCEGNGWYRCRECARHVAAKEVMP